MAGGNVLHRAFQYVINEAVVNALANSRAFQRFAVRTSKRIEDITSLATKNKEGLAEQLKDLFKKFGNKK